MDQKGIDGVVLNLHSVTRLIKQHQQPCVGFFGFKRRATLSISIIFKHDSRPHTSKKRLDVLALDCLAQHMPKMSQMGMCKSGVITKRLQKDHGVGHLFFHVLHRFRGLNKFEAQMLGSRFCSWGFNQHPKGDQPLLNHQQAIVTGWCFGTMEFYDFPFFWECHHPN